ncbi:hypothetical protein LT493_18280 [Streptomyces tricolor]|nr:hypothetical protein [Streptomyces tricolor]
MIDTGGGRQEPQLTKAVDAQGQEPAASEEQQGRREDRPRQQVGAPRTRSATARAWRASSRPAR